jgi:hypothetical protein
MEGSVKKAILTVLLSVSTICLQAGVASAATYTYFTTGDTYADSAGPNTNFGSANVFRTDLDKNLTGSGNKWTYLHFPTSGESTFNPNPNSTFNYVRLCMYAETTYTPSILTPYYAVYASGSFSDKTLTWNNKPVTSATPLFIQQPSSWNAPTGLCQTITGTSDNVKGLFYSMHDIMVRPNTSTQAVRWTSREGSLAGGFSMGRVANVTVDVTPPAVLPTP